jgi:hypothetical protein
LREQKTHHAANDHRDRARNLRAIGRAESGIAGSLRDDVAQGRTLNQHEPRIPMKQAGQKLDGDNLQEVLDAGTNTAQKGRQQFFTPSDIAEALMLPLPKIRKSFVDLTMGAGALLTAAAKGQSGPVLFGIDIDSRLAKRPSTDFRNLNSLTDLSCGNLRKSAQSVEKTNWHCVNADLTKFYPLLQEIDWRFDLCGLNPPFSIKWHRKNLINLIDSECKAVSETFGKSQRGQIDSVIATMLIALDRMTQRGEGFLICGDTIAQKIIELPIGAHVWYWLRIKEATFFPNTHPLNLSVLYFARSHSAAGAGRSAPCSTADLSIYKDGMTWAEVIGQQLAPAAGNREIMRKGLSIHNANDFSSETEYLWDIAAKEWVRAVRAANGTARNPDYNIWLHADGTIRRHLTPFQKFSGKIPRAKADALNRLQGQSPMSLVVQRATRLELLDTINSEIWRVAPELIAAVKQAEKEYHAQRAPFYPLNEVQRLGYLDEEDKIVCRREGLDGFKVGTSYELSSETIDIEHHDTRTNLLGKPEKVTFHGKELAFYIVNGRGERHTFCGVPPEQQSKKSTDFRHPDSLTDSGNNLRKSAESVDKRFHNLESLIRHFHIPEVPDVAQIQPERYQMFVGRIRAIEKQVNLRNAGTQAA